MSDVKYVNHALFGRKKKCLSMVICKTAFLQDIVFTGLFFDFCFLCFLLFVSFRVLFLSRDLSMSNPGLALVA